MCWQNQPIIALASSGIDASSVSVGRGAETQVELNRRPTTSEAAFCVSPVSSPAEILANHAKVSLDGGTSTIFVVCRDWLQVMATKCLYCYFKILRESAVLIEPAAGCWSGAA